MLENKKDYKAWLYLAIPLLLLGVFTFFPLIKTILISFVPEYEPTMDSFGNFGLSLYSYTHLFDPGSQFVTNLGNTLLIVFISVPVSTILALLIAVGLNSIKWFQKIFQTIFFIPYVTNTLAIGMVFATLFAAPNTLSASNGLINYIFHLDVDWVGPNADRLHWMTVVLIYTVWNGLPFKILVFIGGLQNISKQYYDAAKIDSTPSWRVLSKITVPLLSPMISYILITSFIGAFKSYESVIGVFTNINLTTAAYANRNTVVGFTYSVIERTGPGYYSYGAAAAVILFVIILAFTLINMLVSKKSVHY
ncbi:MAG: sugar ABC transporter permease [Acholeplasmatales bacterium]|jgi:multiple sugar transport system permease protein|nr:sugar ABC transporter permease [Acholeplasmatales bacterium]